MGIAQLVSLLGWWSTVIIGVCTWFGHMLAQRLESQWRREEQRRVELLRDGLSSRMKMMEAAMRSQANSQNAFQQRRLTAVDRLWSAVLDLRRRLSAAVFFYTILLPSEYESAYAENEAVRGITSQVSENEIVAAMEATDDVEKERPHVGETLWLQFFVYRAFLGRLAYLIVAGVKKGRFTNWRNDAAIRQLLGYVLPEDRVAELIQTRVDALALNKAVNLLEGMMLEEISLVTSGRRSSDESFENARRLREALATVSPGDTRQSYSAHTS